MNLKWSTHKWTKGGSEAVDEYNCILWTSKLYTDDLKRYDQLAQHSLGVHSVCHCNTWDMQSHGHSKTFGRALKHLRWDFVSRSLKSFKLQVGGAVDLSLGVYCSWPWAQASVVLVEVAHTSSFFPSCKQAVYEIQLNPTEHLINLTLWITIIVLFVCMWSSGL